MIFLRGKDYYQILEVSRDAAQVEIKKAYRNLARRYHPDAREVKAADEARFREITEAYEVLSDPEKRRRYDQFGTVGLGEFDIFSGFPAFDDLFGMFFSDAGRVRQRPSSEPGSDVVLEAEISLEEAATGVKKEFELSRLVSCDSCEATGAKRGTSPSRCNYCKGTGQITSSRQGFFGSFVTRTTCPECGGRGEVILSPCSDCQGEGRHLVSEKISVNVPAGVSDGVQIKVSGQGEVGIRGGAKGDLYVLIRIKPHSVFERQGDDIFCRLPISFTQAVFGAQIPAPSLNGSTKLTIPPGTQPGAVFKLKGKGIPHLRGRGRGDQVVEVTVSVPKRLTKEQKRLLHEFAKTCQEV